MDGYGRFQDFTLAPARRPGAVVIGSNEAGKSTLASALFRVLFGFPDKAGEDARRPWAGAPFRVAAEWAVGAEEVCRIERDFDTQDVTVEWRRSGGALEVRWSGRPNPRGGSSDREAYDGHLRRLLGFTSPDIFRQTAFVGPGDPQVRPLASELLRLLSGSERSDFRAALDALEEGHYGLTRVDLRDPSRSAKHKPRRLEEIALERVALQGRRDASERARAARRVVEDELGAVRDRLADVERDLLERRSVQEAMAVLKQVRQEVEALEARRADLDAAAERFNDWERTVRERTGALQPLVRYLRLPPDYPERIARLERLDEERTRVTGEERTLDARLTRGGRTGRPAWAASAGAALALAGAMAAVAGISLAAAWAAAAAGIVLVLWGGWQWRDRRTGHRKRLARRAELAEEASRLEVERKTLTEPLEVELDDFDPAGERARYAHAQRLRAELDGMKAARGALGDREVIERERRAIKEERLDILRLEQRRVLEAHPYLAEGAEYERRFLQEQARLRQERDRLREEELRHRRALADLPGAPEDPRRLDAEIARLDEEAERLGVERDAYRLAFDTLSDCKDGFLRVMTRRIERRIGEILDDLTEGRYGAVEIDPGTLELRVHGPEKRDVPATVLSRGAADQLYFALRAALIEELAAERALPLVLDDPFLHFDRRRLEAVERTLARLGERHQVLLLTHDPRLAEGLLPRHRLPTLAAPAGWPSAG